MWAMIGILLVVLGLADGDGGVVLLGIALIVLMGDY